jgi:hypothetical protein
MFAERTGTTHLFFLRRPFFVWCSDAYKKPWRGEHSAIFLRLASWRRSELPGGAWHLSATNSFRMCADDPRAVQKQVKTTRSNWGSTAIAEEKPPAMVTSRLMKRTTYLAPSDER